MSASKENVWVVERRRVAGRKRQESKLTGTRTYRRNTFLNIGFDYSASFVTQCGMMTTEEDCIDTMMGDWKV